MCSTLSNWALEFSKWAPSIKVVHFRGPKHTRKAIYRDQIQPGKFNVVLTSYE